jgi:hypothetical protein
MMKYAKYAVRAVGIVTFLMLMVFNVDVVGSQGVQVVASSAEAECELCDENSVLCAVYEFPDGTVIQEYDETGVVITPEEE